MMKKLAIVLWCGWILWAHSPLEWNPMDGFDTYITCKAKADRMNSNDEKLGHGTLWSCFPSDFDPRGKTK